MSKSSKLVNCKACDKEIAKGVKKCVHCGKDQRNFFGQHKFLTFILAIIVVVGLSKAMGGGGSTTGDTATATGTADKTAKTASTAKTTSTTPEVKKDDITFSNILVTSNSGTTTVNGEAKSNDGQKHSFTIKVSFYDKTKKLLGTAMGTINELQPTDTKIFTAMATEDFTKSASYKVEVDTMVQSSAPDKASVITFSNLVSKGQSGTTTVDGEVKNVDTKEHSFTLVIGFYDKDGKLIGTAVGAMNNLGAGATKTYTAMSVGDFSKASKTKIQVDTLVQ